MSRTIDLSLTPGKSQGLAQDLQAIDGVVGIAIQPGASIKPPGDLMTLQVTNDAIRPVLQVLADHDVGQSGSIVSSEPRSLVSGTSQRQIDRENDEASWPEMATLLRRETNLTINYSLAMFFAGIIAAVGMWTDTIHIVIGAMVIAPGFEPILRIPFGLLAKDSHAWRQGLTATAGGYAALIAGAALSVVILRLLPGPAREVEALHWVQYWSTLKAPSVLVGFAAGAAGAAIIAAHRSVLTAGVMVALALIPSASVIGMAAVVGEFGLAWEALMRWAVEALLVISGGGLVLAIKRGLHPNPKGAAQSASPL